MRKAKIIMSPKDNKDKGRTFNVTLGEETIQYKAENKSTLDFELFFLNLILYGFIFAFSLDYLSIPIFVLFFYCLGLRAFIGNHDRMHTNHSRRNPRWFEAFSEYFWVVVTPWDEPYDSIKTKHFIHHAMHSSGKTPVLDSTKDPHSVYEMGGIVRVFFSCLFNEEYQLYLDVRDKRLTKSRLYKLIVYTPLIILFITTFGWVKFLVIFMAMRWISCSGWFVFSWVFHQPYFYHFGFSKKLPKWIVYLVTFLFGPRIGRGVSAHAVHHAWPGVPFNELKKFDLFALDNAQSAPDMVPSKS